MRYLAPFRDPALARALAATIACEADPGRHYRLMEFCGGHTHAIFRHGVRELMPPNVEFLHGPGCPVCVLPVARLDQVIELTRRHDPILCTYGDMMRVPASGGATLYSLKAEGGEVRVVGSPLEALELARRHPGREVLFFAIGFETTAPATAAAIERAAAEGLENFSVFCNHLLTPPAIAAILDAGEVAIDAVLGPAHVSTVIGTRPYEALARRFATPLVVAGFEPLDVMQAARMAITRINRGEARVENQYRRAVGRDGNRKARAVMERVLTPRPEFEWRGLGTLAGSALAIAPPFARFDAEARFPLESPPAREPKGCICPQVLRGVKRPPQCPLFGTACTPERPVGACMVSSEGACAAHWSYGRG